MPNGFDGDATDVESPAYHIVCHDCPTEFVSRSESDAERHFSEHRSSTGHNVEYADLTGEGSGNDAAVESE
jgi:hypothetical protein